MSLTIMKVKVSMKSFPPYSRDRSLTLKKPFLVIELFITEERCFPDCKKKNKYMQQVR